MNRTNRHYAEVRKVNSGETTPEDFCKELNMDPKDWAQVWAASRIYCEDSILIKQEPKYSEIEFIESINPETPEIVKGQELAW